MNYDLDYVLVECELEGLKDLIEQLEPQYDIKILRYPSKCMTMIETADSVEDQPFYLGEALTTECEVAVFDRTGYGVCLGDQPIRCYCIAFVDAVRQLNDTNWNTILEFVKTKSKEIYLNEQKEFNHILRTRVDFKLMEEA